MKLCQWRFVFKKGIALKSSAMDFKDLQVVEDIILAHITLPEALIAKKVKVKKLANILKWLAPISTLQTDEMLRKIREEDLAIIEKNLREIGY